MPSIHDLSGLDAYARQRRLDRHHLKQLRNAFYKHHGDKEVALRELPEEQRLEFSSNVDFHFLHLHSRDDSRIDGASKLVFRTERGFAIETVILRIATGRTALCVSTQVGCGLVQKPRILGSSTDSGRGCPGGWIWQDESG